VLTKLCATVIERRRRDTAAMLPTAREHINLNTSLRLPLDPLDGQVASWVCALVLPGP
jgi:hypothetical protein